MDSIILTLLTTGLAPVVTAFFDRELEFFSNPNCSSSPSLNCSDYSLLYVKALGRNDSLHYLWNSDHKPSLLLLESTKDSNLSITWPDFVNGSADSIRLTSPISYAFGLVINKIIEFNDIGDTGFMNETSKETLILSADNFKWRVKSFYQNPDSGTVNFEVTANGYSSEDIVKNGTISFLVSVFPSKDHGIDLPHLLHTANSTQIDMTIDHFTTAYPNSRFAVELAFVSSETENSDLELKSKKSLDDEHSPGVFTVIELQTENSKKGNVGGYLQWRPLVYTFNDRDYANSTDTVHYHVENITTEQENFLNNSLPFVFFEKNISQLAVRAMNVSFGFKLDGFYRKSGYLSWSFLVGIGEPPVESFSMLVLLIIGIGLGLPTLVIIGGFFFVVFRRLSRNKDELFFSQ
ncbi:unnamed protein product [Bemisia tabaci]|uniref:Lysosomal protein NCU-G1 n=1 Tax=Bemisia tabaci TaxID=7038 RepID=A0A9P0A8I6_BEMTA|nr:unnamed protein product [Bemisia tabaci]